jgi:hypothetical protein
VTNAEASRFAEEWIDSFNRKDVDSVLSHFAENATFRSPRAAAFGWGTCLNSREHLRMYWTTALRSLRSLHFTLDCVVNDPTERLLVIIYVAEIDGGRVRASEVYEFDSLSRIIHGEAMYGAQIPAPEPDIPDPS